MIKILTLTTVLPRYMLMLSHLNSDQEGNFEQHALQLSDGDVIDGSRAKFAVKEFGTQILQVSDGKRPQVKDVVARESIAFFDDDGFGSE